METKTGNKKSSFLEKWPTMLHARVKDILETDNFSCEQTVVIKGWVRTVRHQKAFSFIELNDGSCLKNLQIIADNNLAGYQEIVDTLCTGCSAEITGILVQSPGKNQALELKASQVTITGKCPSDYPLQKKRHSFEFLRSIAHLRARTNTQGAIARVRSAAAFATHLFFQQNHFYYIQTPILTASDCEGSGALFSVESKEHKNFFGKPAFLTVSGQLEAEAMAQALSKVYTFGPTFRAENSHTSRHLAEFWMIEPEIAFGDLNDVIHLADEYVKFVVDYLFKHCESDLQFFDQWVEKGLIQRLENVLKSPLKRVEYTEAIAILEKASISFEYPVKWGIDLQTEHERYLTEQHFKQPIVVINYPKEIKAFYMRDNADGKTVAAMDLLVPKVGELIGGAQREDRMDHLREKMKLHGLNEVEYQWYLDLREYGSTVHGGFGLGFERLLLFLTGMENIRDVIAFPRIPGFIEF